MIRTRALVAVLALSSVACSVPGRTPVHVVEEHHRMLLVLDAAGVDRATLVHVDAHADLGLPSLSASLLAADGESRPERAARLRRLVDEDLAADDVIVPAAALGFVGAVVWVTPAWLTVPAGTETIEIGSRGGRGRDYVRGTALDEVTYPDRLPLEITTTDIDGIPRVAAPWVLGIDLDFLACRNPHARHADRPATEAEARRVLESGRIIGRGESDGGVSTLVSVPGEVCPHRVDRVTGGDAVRWTIGWRCLGEACDSLPAHEPAPGEIDRVLRRLADALARIPERPVLVVICRSAGSGFVPADRVDDLEARVLRVLRRLDPAPPTRYASPTSAPRRRG